MNYIQELEKHNSFLEDELEKLNKEFLEFRKKIYSGNQETCTLREAARNGNLDAVEFHIDNGADVHEGMDQPLHSASEYGHLDVVRFLLANGADIHADSDYALQLASMNGHLETVKFLLENGANIHADDDIALTWAVEHGHLEVVKFLISSGADIRAADDYVGNGDSHKEVCNYLKTLKKL
jgi:ankyrin repeat protein